MKRVPTRACLAVWGMQPLPARAPPGLRIMRLEDGFLRSVGLGSELTQPLSWVVDGRGIYYDASRSSDLEALLSTAEFPAALVARARALRQQVVGAHLTKYNVGKDEWRRPATRGRLILVPGQVESDASLAYGAPGIRHNMDLLQAVRAANPGACVIYKPHPDVTARLRAAGAEEHLAARWCDAVASDVSMSCLLEAVDEVHVMTSLAGFEALLRHKPVT